MATTNLGKIKRVDRIRNAIYDELMEGMMNNNIDSHIFLDREILFYTLLNHNVTEKEALYCTTKIYGEGRQIVSRGLKETFACTSNELGQKQFTKFISKFMKSGRIEILDTSPYTWRMNGFSTHEEPYIAGFESKEGRKIRLEIQKIENPKKKIENTKRKLIIVDKKILKINKKILNGNIEPEIITTRKSLFERKKMLQHKLSEV